MLYTLIILIIIVVCVPELYFNLHKTFLEYFDTIDTTNDEWGYTS